MIINGVGGRKGPKKGGVSRAAAARHRVRHTVNYITREALATDVNGQALRFTNLAGDKPESWIRDMEAWKTLRPGITDPVRHVVFSPERADRLLTAEDWQKAIDAYREARGLGDAPYLAQVHTDGHEHRHPQHLHLVFIRIKSDGSPVDDSLDVLAHRAASRRIEAELGLTVNAGADPKSKHKGTNARMNRGRAGEREGFKEAQIHVDPERVRWAIARSTGPRELRQNLAAVGIECRMRAREGSGTYAWSLRNVDGPKVWTSGSKLTQGNELGWAKVEAMLAANRHGKAQAMARMRAWPARTRRANDYKSSPLATPARPRRLEEQVEQAAADGLALLRQILGELGRVPRAMFSAGFAQKPVQRKLAELADTLEKPTFQFGDPQKRKEWARLCRSFLIKNQERLGLDDLNPIKATDGELVAIRAAHGQAHLPQRQAQEAAQRAAQQAQRPQLPLTPRPAGPQG